MKNKIRHISDEELLILAKHLDQTQIAQKLGITQQRVSKRLTTIKKCQTSLNNTKKKEEAIKLDPKKISTERLLEIIYSSLIAEKDKEDIPPNIKLSINRELLHLAEIQSRVRQEILESKAMDIIIDEINLILKELDPIKQQRFWEFIRTNSKLLWLAGETDKEPILTEESTIIKKEENVEKAKFDSDLL